jgi:hypothetical protein
MNSVTKNLLLTLCLLATTALFPKNTPQKIASAITESKLVNDAVDHPCIQEVKDAPYTQKMLNNPLECIQIICLVDSVFSLGTGIFSMGNLASVAPTPNQGINMAILGAKMSISIFANLFIAAIIEAHKRDKNPVKKALASLFSRNSDK